MAVGFQTALQLVFYDLLKVVAAEAIQTARFKKLLQRLKNTLISIQPVFYDSWRLSTVLLDRPQKETLLFILYLKRAKKLVLKSSSITFRNKYQKILHSYKLIRFNAELVSFFQTELQVNNLEDNVAQLLPGFATRVSVDNGSCRSTAPTVINSHLEELRVNIRSENYSLPKFVNRMGNLKVLSITGHGDHSYKLHNLSFIPRLSNLTTIRIEHVSVPSLQPVFALRNLTQLSFVMCEIGDALMSFTTESPHTLPSLTRLEIDMCYDLKQLPSGLCNLVRLQNLSITNCHELDGLPKGLGRLSSLESLSLHCCTKLQGLPESIGGLCNLSSIDISDCLSISVLPEEIGELCGLRVLKMNGCTGLQELPVSTGELLQLEEVVCDEETSYLWMDFESHLHNLKINVVEDDRLETFMKIVH